MRTGGEPGPVEAENFPPVYLTRQPHTNARMRYLKIPTLFILRQILFIKHLVLLTQITRGPLIIHKYRGSQQFSRVEYSTQIY